MASTSHSPTWDAEGSFNFRTLICELLQSGLTTTEPYLKGDESQFALLYTAFAARRMVDAFRSVSLPQGLSSESLAKLHHERVHYWQFISSPILQFRFVCFLASVATEIAALDGRAEEICGSGLVGYKPVVDVNAYRGMATRLRTIEDADSRWHDVTPEEVTGAYYFDVDRSVGIVTFLISTKLGEHYPAAGAVFRHVQSEYFVPFTVKPLIESAALLSQMLFQKKPLPLVDDPRNQQQLLYRGCWEFWKRIHGSRYKPLTQLALSFIAAVDLALAGDFLIEPERPELVTQLRCVSVRFAAIARASVYVNPVCTRYTSPRIAAATFQEEICRILGWPSPSETAKSTTVYLTRQIYLSFMHKLDWTPEAEAIGDRLLSDAYLDLAENIELLRPIWRGFPNNELTPGSSTIGFRMLATMLCACYDRIRYPGLFATPNHSSNELCIRYPLPVILFNGRYHSDSVNEAYDPDGKFFETMLDQPSIIPGPFVGLDAINLLALSRLASGEHTCGFISRFTDSPMCYYTNHGLGCPYTTLSLAEQQLRNAYQLDDWCHWTFLSIQTEIGSHDVLDRWLKVYEKSKNENNATANDIMWQAISAFNSHQ